MINEYIRYRISQEKQAEFVEAYAKAGACLRASPVCLGYELSQCEEEPDCFILRILWQSTADHLQKFRGSAEFKEFFALIKPYLANIDEMRHYRLTDIRWTRA
jgi:hemoglobin